MRVFLILASLCFATIEDVKVAISQTERADIQSSIDEIDAQLEELRDMKRGFESRALRFDDQGNRLQFEDHFYLEARRYFRLADENRMKAAKVQEEIDRLEAKKRELQLKLNS